MTQLDIPATNGYIHHIDGLLTSESLLPLLPHRCDVISQRTVRVGITCFHLCVKLNSLRARLHQRRSNLGSTGLSSSVNGNLNELSHISCTNVNSVQLNHSQLNRVQGGATKCDLNSFKSPFTDELSSVEPRLDRRWCNRALLCRLLCQLPQFLCAFKVTSWLFLCTLWKCINWWPHTVLSRAPAECALVNFIVRGQRTYRW